MKLLSLLLLTLAASVCGAQPPADSMLGLFGYHINQPKDSSRETSAFMLDYDYGDRLMFRSRDLWGVLARFYMIDINYDTSGRAEWIAVTGAGIQDDEEGLLQKCIGEVSDTLQSRLGKPHRTNSEKSLRSMRRKRSPVVLSQWEWGEGIGRTYRPTRRVRFLMYNNRALCTLGIVIERL